MLEAVRRDGAQVSFGVQSKNVTGRKRRAERNRGCVRWENLKYQAGKQ